MRYLGNKTKLLNNIQTLIEKYDIQGKTFADIFCGTASVADFFKDKYNVITNDFMYYSYIIANAKLNNKIQPRFLKFKKKFEIEIFDYLNSIDTIFSDNSFIYKNYTPEGDRMFFTESNGAKIDTIRMKIEDLYINKDISQNEYFYLLASLIDSVSSFSNISGTYEAFFKFWESRASKTFVLSPIELNETNKNGKHNFFCKSTNDLVREISGDIAYIDPPYTVTQYASAYHLLETVAKYDYPLITGIGGKRGKGKNVSLFSRKNEAIIAMEDLLRQIDFNDIIISYSNQGLINVDDLIDLCKKFAVGNEVFVEYIDYNEYKTHRSSNKQNGKKLNELLIYFKKDRSVIKSSLNYSGSKDTLVKKIINELPYHVDNFIDMMGGAFNVGSNVVAMNKVIYNEKNTFVYELINFLSNSNKDEIVRQVEDVVRKYNLAKSGKVEYLNLRNNYNISKELIELYVLHLYSFQNMIRFNKSGGFNTPCGVAAYSDEMRSRIIKFKCKTNNVEYVNSSYDSIDFKNYSKDTIFYFDPPYYITSAHYNDGKRGCDLFWDANEETKLLNYLIELHTNGYKFILSNVIEHKGNKHNILIEWIQEHEFKLIDIGTSGYRYIKKEILVKNF